MYSQISNKHFPGRKRSYHPVRTSSRDDEPWWKCHWGGMWLSLRGDKNETKNLNNSIFILGGWCWWRWVHQLWRICENIYFAQNPYAEINRMLPYFSCLKNYSERLILIVRILRISSLQVAMMQSAGHYSKVDGGWTWFFLCAIFQVILT